MDIQSTKWLTDWLIGLGIGEFSALYLKLALLLFTLFIVCFIINLIVKKLIIHSIELVVKKTKNAWDDALVENKVFITIAHIVPALVINIAPPYIFDDFSGAIPYVIRLVNAYISIIIIIVIKLTFN